MVRGFDPLPDAAEAAVPWAFVGPVGADPEPGHALFERGSGEALSPTNGRAGPQRGAFEQKTSTVDVAAWQRRASTLSPVRHPDQDQIGINQPRTQTAVIGA